MIIFGLVAGLVFIGLFCYMAVYLLATRKHSIDQDQFNACQAGGGAMMIGFKKLDKVLYWFGVASVKEMTKALKELWEMYFQDPRGPMRLAFDIFMETWPKLRRDKEFGDRVREEVIHEALGIDINNKTDIDAVEAGMRAERIGWSTIRDMAKSWAVRDWMKFGELLRSLFREFMQQDGEIKIAMRVANPTFAALWGNKSVPGAHDTAQKLVETYAAELGWTPPAAAAT